MPGNYQDRLREAEALVQRARDAHERQAFEEIANIWRRLAQREPPPSPNSPEEPAPQA